MFCFIMFIPNITFPKISFYCQWNGITDSLCHRSFRLSLVHQQGLKKMAPFLAVLRRVTTGRWIVHGSVRDFSTVCECGWLSSLILVRCPSGLWLSWSRWQKVFIEEVPNEVQGTDIGWERNALSRLFYLIWALIETTLQLCPVALNTISGHYTSGTPKFS